MYFFGTISMTYKETGILKLMDFGLVFDGKKSYDI